MQVLKCRTRTLCIIEAFCVFFKTGLQIQEQEIPRNIKTLGFLIRIMSFIDANEKRGGE